MRLAVDKQLLLGRRALLSVCTAAAVISGVDPSVPSHCAAAAGGPSSLSGKPRPETGVVLLEPVDQTGTTVSAELLLADASNKNGGISAVAPHLGYEVGLWVGARQMIDGHLLIGIIRARPRPISAWQCDLGALRHQTLEHRVCALEDSMRKAFVGGGSWSHFLRTAS